MRTWKNSAPFVLTVAVLLVAFVSTTVVLAFHSHAIGRATHGISDNAVPSVESLLRAQADAARLQDHLERYASEPNPSSAEHQRIWVQVDTLRRDIEVYVLLPRYAGEVELSEELFARMNELTPAIRTVLALAEVEQHESAKTVFNERVAPILEALQTALVRGEELNVVQIRGFASDVQRVRKTSLRVTFILTVLTLLLAAALMSWARSVARHQRALEAAEQQTLRNRADELEAFSARVAHDIRSPLGATGLALDLLARSSKDPNVRRLAGRARSGISRVGCTVDGLLEFARSGAAPLETVTTNVLEVARSVLDTLADQARNGDVTLDVEAFEDRYDVHASEGVLTSVLTNLVQNAIQHMDGSPERRVTVRLHRRGPRVRVEVRDTGPGVPRGLERRIFEAYVRAAQGPTGGLGLGLATAKRLVEAHGGAIGVERLPPRGSSFWFEMPAPDPLDTTRAGPASAARSQALPCS